MPAQAFDAQVRREKPRAIILDLHGEINGFAEDALNRAYAEAERERPDTILLNFSDVGYINSTGIALIVGLLARARQQHIPLRACGLSEHYMEIFTITRLVDFMGLYGDEATALASAPAGSGKPSESA